MYEQEHRRSFGAVLGWTLLGSLLPGLGLLVAGRRRLGGIVLAFSVLLYAGGAWLVLLERDDLLRGAVDSASLRIAIAALVGLGLCWVTVIVASYRSLRPVGLSAPKRAGGSVLVALLATVVVAPVAAGSWLLVVQQDLIGTVFKPADRIRSETTPENVTPEDPWGGRERLNILLLGSDGGKGRSEEFGERTDTVMVASIDVDNGDTALFGLPRNLLRIPFPEGSELDRLYPRGFGPDRDFSSETEQLEYMLTSIYKNLPAENPGLLESDNPGADAVKLGVGEALGLDLDYYVAVNLSGFEELIDALGGITVNINYPVPIGGETGGPPPIGYLEPGPEQTLQGEDALWFARGRYNLDDYRRMERQRCVVDAVIEQAEPMNILRRYQQLAEASKKMVRTDIPDSLLGPLVELAPKVQHAEFESVILDEDNSGIVPYDVDYDRMRQIVRQTLEPGRPSDSPSAAEDDERTGEGSDESDGSGDPSPSPSPSPSPGQEGPDAEQESDPCAYAPHDPYDP